MTDFANKFVTVLLVIALQLPYTSIALAQNTPDVRSPTIQLQAISEAQADNAQVFTATVIEDRVLKDVLLYYRFAGQVPFSAVAMTKIGKTENYGVSLQTDPTDLRAIEYYIQARDESGNRTVEGYAFDPYRRVLIANEIVINASPQPSNTVADSNSIASTDAGTDMPTDTKNDTGKVRWWHIVAGVVVVGAAATLVGGSGDENASTSDGTVPLTINIPGP